MVRGEQWYTPSSKRTACTAAGAMLQKRSLWSVSNVSWRSSGNRARGGAGLAAGTGCSGDTLRPRYSVALDLSLIHISEPTRLGMISYAVFCLKKKKKQTALCL